MSKIWLFDKLMSVGWSLICAIDMFTEDSLLSNSPSLALNLKLSEDAVLLVLWYTKGTEFLASTVIFPFIALWFPHTYQYSPGENCDKSNFIILDGVVDPWLMTPEFTRLDELYPPFDKELTIYNGWLFPELLVMLISSPT